MEYYGEREKWKHFMVLAELRSHALMKWFKPPEMNYCRSRHLLSNYWLEVLTGSLDSSLLNVYISKSKWNCLISERLLAWRCIRKKP